MMSTVPNCLRNIKLIADSCPHNFTYQLTKAQRYPSYSSFRNMFSNLTSKKNQPEKIEEPEEGTTKSTNDDLTKLKKEFEEVAKMVEEVKSENEALNDKYKRALADGENMRVRLTKQIEDAKIFGIQSFCKDLIEVSDVLGKATECVPKEEVSDANPHLKNLYEGLIMTENVLEKVFARHGLVVVNPINEKFDPNQHEALFEQEVEGKKPGTVVVVSKIGYKLRGRIIRPALVGVSK